MAYKIGGKCGATADHVVPLSMKRELTCDAIDAMRTGRRLIKYTTKRRLGDDGHNEGRNDSEVLIQTTILNYDETKNTTTRKA